MENNIIASFEREHNNTGISRLRCCWTLTLVTIGRKMKLSANLTRIETDCREESEHVVLHDLFFVKANYLTSRRYMSESGRKRYTTQDQRNRPASSQGTS
jgi:hypothetical protein